MKTITSRNSILVLALTAGFTLLALASAHGQKTGDAAQTSTAAQTKEACSRNLTRIYEAIQDFRRDQQQLPHWLSDLVPKYLPDSSVLTCPAASHADNAKSYPHVADPKIATAYVYEFCDGEA